MLALRDNMTTPSIWLQQKQHTSHSRKKAAQ